MGAVRWEPGRKDRAPFSRVHFSKAIQNPSAVGGEVYFGYVSGVDQKQKGKLAGTQGTYCDTTKKLISGQSCTYWKHSRVVVLWN